MPSTSHLQSTMETIRTEPLKCCPFCSTAFKRLGNHLPHCQERKGRDYSSLLSEKTLQKKKKTSSKKTCPTCGKLFTRLDTHLRISASCKAPGLPNDQSGLTEPTNAQSSDTAEPASLPVHTCRQTTDAQSSDVAEPASLPVHTCRQTTDSPASPQPLPPFQDSKTP